MKTCICGAKLSSNANRCPSCGQNQGKTFECKTCGKTLFFSDHHRTGSTTTFTSGVGNTTNRDFQLPCTKCGEQNPIPFVVYAKTAHPLISFILVPAFVVLLIAILIAAIMDSVVARDKRLAAAGKDPVSIAKQQMSPYKKSDNGK